MITTILIILGVLLLLKVINFSWTSLLFVICVILTIIYLPEILTFLFNLVVDIMTAIMEFAFP
jgi:hypothetical protein